ncbi:MAG TPA: PIN domain-containing protein [Polyangiaceae bacterium]|nr:PIN domain-containing protein [Polyangiaceae bacterium]
MSVVVDTSIWVEYFRGKGAAELDRLLNEGLVVIAPVVAAELLSAPLTRAERRELGALLGNLPLHPTPLSHWLSVGELRADLARGGLHVSTPDAHVARCALESEAFLWSNDGVFQRIAKRAELSLFRP